ncbi:HNH endonuclease [Nocardioides rubriscoriae]|uniref:HNH endonuclease n=1 Tax=Nocardioides rubriscoriae TaxID=642762 RepID=UPI0011E001C3|nr:HNH endonuclease [Nocardioides rubriscoriae]
MTSTQTLLDPALAAVAQARDWKRQSEVAELVAVLDWTGAHQVGDALVATPGLRLGGVGCPVISEFDTWDLSCVLGQSADSCTTYVGNALELRHRLPRLWQRVLDLQVPVWRAFRITARTQCLPQAGAADVDRALAHCAHTITLGQVDRTIAVALATHNPAEAEDRRRRADEARCFDIDLTDNPIVLGGTVEVHGVLDLADALDLDAAVSAAAAQLADLGSDDTLDVRRAAAAGEIARGQLALDLPTNPDTGTSAGTGPGRGVTLYAHVDGSDVATVNGTPVLVDQLITWCTRPGVKVTIKPVIDLNADLTTHGYVPDTRLAEQVDLRDRRCVFPFCTRHRTDRDHTEPYDHDTDDDDGDDDAGDDDAGDLEADAQTRSSNLARLCRGHHRAKTFSLWSYESPAPGVYLWRSPAGATYLVDRTTEP